MATPSLNWKMTQSGSANFILSFPRDAVEIHTTYVGDGLGSVVRAAVDLGLGSSSAIAFLPAEPGGTCLFFGDARETAYMQIVRFSDMQSESGRWSGGYLQWHGRVDVEEFIRNVALMGDEVLSRCGGSEGYSRKWGGIPFPSGELKSLRLRLEGE
ncbi:hypothetical protein [Streptomyces sp. NPDC058272]|uniref:hypothetical protein n=1 Tax=Streptomyces sp. NPDC058272 TaxID=3346415 RepID=UPI0036E58A1F